MIITAKIRIPDGEKCFDSSGYCCGLVDMSSHCDIFNEHIDFYAKENSYDPAKCKKCLKACGILNDEEVTLEAKVKYKVKKQPKIKKQDNNEQPKKRGRPKKQK